MRVCESFRVRAYVDANCFQNSFGGERARDCVCVNLAGVVHMLIHCALDVPEH